ncbi:hypothetical protein [Pseudonocardia sp. ICBG1142]|nr:hypothetical protein [Pseudonocardia sp. ICBG1142]
MLTSPAGNEPVAQLLAGWQVAVLVATGFTLLGALVALGCARAAAPAGR